MTIESSTPTLADLFAAQLRAYSDGLRVLLPAEVTRWSAADAGRVSVRPTIRLVRRSEGALLSYRPPIVSDVPIAWPGAGDYGVSFPLTAGSTGCIVFADRSLDEWVTSGNPDSEPRDVRRHAYTDAVFLPGLRPLAGPSARAAPTATATVVSCPTAGEVRLGSAAAVAPVALGTLTDAQFSALASAFSSWAPVPNDGGAALKAILTTLLASWPASVGSARVKSE